MRKVNLIPMAGAGQRFVDAGYTVPKPLIKIDGSPMFLRAASCLPAADLWIFICRKEHLQTSEMESIIKMNFPNAEVVPVEYLTDGQASTCMLAQHLIELDDRLTIGACDNGMRYDMNGYINFIEKSEVLIWTFRNNPSVLKKPEMYGWVAVDHDGRATRVACKEPLSTSPLNDHAVIGAFSFSRAEFFFESVDSMIKRNRRINNEFYVDVAVDECIRRNLEVFPFEVLNYDCWGTPNDLENYSRDF